MTQFRLVEDEEKGYKIIREEEDEGYEIDESYVEHLEPKELHHQIKARPPFGDIVSQQLEKDGKKMNVRFNDNRQDFDLLMPTTMLEALADFIEEDFEREAK